MTATEALVVMVAQANSMAYLHAARVRWESVPKPKPTYEEGKKAFPTAVQLMLYSACLHSVLYDLQAEMNEIGQYRHSKKRWLNEAIDKVGYIHNSHYKGLDGYDSKFGQWYNQQMEKAENTINECILVEPPHRAYSIAMALFRMVVKANDKCGRYRSSLVDCLMKEAVTLINRCDFPVEDKHIDFILESQIDTKNLIEIIEDSL